MEEENSADSNKEQSENESNNLNIVEQSDSESDTEITEELNNSNVNKDITTKETTFKSTDVLIKSSGSTNPIGQDENSSNKSGEIIGISEASAEEEAMDVEEPPPPPPPPPLPPPPPPPPPEPAPKVHAQASTSSAAVDAGTSANGRTEEEGQSSDTGDIEARKLFNRKRGFRGFFQNRAAEPEEVLLDLFDQEEIEVIQTQVVDQQSEFNSPPPPKKRRFVNRATMVRNNQDFAVPSTSQGIGLHRGCQACHYFPGICTSPAFSNHSQLSLLSLPKNGSPASKTSRKSSVDLRHPRFLMPFEFGWKREVVTRSITSREDGLSKDVYYFHPVGKKLRSLREVSEKLTPGLVSEHFTFYKDPIGVIPSYEVVRNARTPGQSSGNSSTPRRTPVRRPRSTSRKSNRTPSQGDSSDPASNPPETSTPRTSTRKPRQELRDPTNTFAVPTTRVSTRCNKGTPKIALRGPVSTTTVSGGQPPPRPSTSREDPKPHPDAPEGPRRKITPRKADASSGTDYSVEFLSQAVQTDALMSLQHSLQMLGDVTTIPLTWNHFDAQRTTEEGDLDYCTIRCTNAVGLIPTLQCSICLYIYHPDCCDMIDITAVWAAIKYICENCQAKSPGFRGRGLIKNIAPALITCGKSPPIISPRPIRPVITYPLTSVTRFSSMIPQTRPRQRSSSTRFRGVRAPRGIATPPVIPTPPSFPTPPTLPTQWRPPRNTVFRSPIIAAPTYQRPEGSSSPPQSIITLNSRRYILVPKRHVFPVIPNPDTTPPRAESPMRKTIITPTPTSTIIEGPPLMNNPFIRMTSTGPVCVFPFGAFENPDTDPSSQNSVNSAAGSSRSGQPDLSTESDTPDNTESLRDVVPKRPTAGVDPSMQNFMRNICIGYTALLHVFEYLKVQELLRAGRVCRLWRDCADHTTLWQTVRMKNSQVSDWEGFIESLVRHGTKFLDLRKMLVSLDETEEMWSTFAKNMSTVTTLEGLEMCRCSVAIIEQILESCPQLLVFNATMIGLKEQTVSQNLKLEIVSKMTKLKELRLKSCHGMNAIGSLRSFTSLAPTLTVLCLTSIKNLGFADVHYLAELQNLEVLELGDCTDLPQNFPTVVVAKLPNLKRARFEKNPVHFTSNDLATVVKNLGDLSQLELVNFDIKPGFDKIFAACTNVKRLLLIPTYVTQSATTNHIILTGLLGSWKHLTNFDWVLTLELMKVTELFIDQCDLEPSKKKYGLPVLKPMPYPPNQPPLTEIEIRMEENVGGVVCVTPIVIVPVEEVNDMLAAQLPNTRIKIMKIPFQNTWRHYMAEGSVP